jgi:hypothetical protein
LDNKFLENFSVLKPKGIIFIWVASDKIASVSGVVPNLPDGITDF